MQTINKHDDTLSYSLGHFLAVPNDNDDEPISCDPECELTQAQQKTFKNKIKDLKDAGGAPDGGTLEEECEPVGLGDSTKQYNCTLITFPVFQGYCPVGVIVISKRIWNATSVPDIPCAEEAFFCDEQGFITQLGGQASKFNLKGLTEVNTVQCILTCKTFRSKNQ